MKDLARLIIVAILSFAVVGAAVFYSRDSDALGTLTAVLDGSQLPHLPDVATSASARPESAQSQLWIARPRQDQWMGLAGFPDAIEVRFPVPAGLVYSRATLDLAFDSQLAQGGDGRLSIRVDGVPRDEIVLDPGQSSHRVEIDLDPDTIAGRAVTVSLAGQGSVGAAACPARGGNSGAAITLLPESGLALFTDDPVDGIEARLAALPDPLYLALGTTPEAQAMAIWTAQALRRAGLEVRIPRDDATAGLAASAPGGSPLAFDAAGRIALSGEAGIEALLVRRAASVGGQVRPAAWPVSAERLGAETDLRAFREVQRWTLSYALADLDRGLVPTRLDIALKASVLEPGSNWLVRVSLNGNMTRTARIDGQSETIALSVELPVEMQALFNTVQIELIDASPMTGACMPIVEAQLLPGTTLSAGPGQPGEGWSETIRALSRLDRIGLTVDTPLTAEQARTARDLLRSFLPAGAEVVFGEDAATAPATLSITSGEQLRAALRLAGRMGAATGDLYLALPRQDDDPELLALADASAAIERLADDAVAILISR